MNPPQTLTPRSAKGLTWLGHTELNGRPDGVQVMVNKGYAFVGHPFTGGGVTVVDVRDPCRPTAINFLKTHPRSWSLHFQTFEAAIPMAGSGLFGGAAGL